MNRLYIRIYLTVLGSLLVFALLAGLAAAMLSVLDDDERRPWGDMGADVAERLLPADRDPAALAAELDYWRERTGFSLMLLSSGGEVMAQSGMIPPDIRDRAEERREGRRRIWRARGGLVGLTMDDGRQFLALGPDDGHRWFRRLRWLAALLGIGLAVGIAAYPLVRHLARRLERLETGVAAFGDGDLKARVPVSGRDEIARLAVTFNASADRIEDLLNAHRNLLANASHELRSPLSRLRMAVARLDLTGAGEPDRIEINRNIEELDELVEEILLASRLQANAASEIRWEDVDLVGLLAEECAPFDAELEAPPGETLVIEGDSRLLRRLFRNLFDNASRYAGDEPTTVTLHIHEGDIRVAVCDRGPGIPEAEREAVFEPFHRLTNTPESLAGAGLGLALVRQIALRHGGSARCKAREGGGTCFEIRLPKERPAG
ncbi:MAG: ATP-binding protein [Rhodomicrobiaceae bacterium]